MGRNGSKSKEKRGNKKGKERRDGRASKYVSASIVTIAIALALLMTAAFLVILPQDGAPEKDPRDDDDSGYERTAPAAPITSLPIYLDDRTAANGSGTVYTFANDTISFTTAADGKEYEITQKSTTALKMSITIPANVNVKLIVNGIFITGNINVNNSATSSLTMLLADENVIRGSIIAAKDATLTIDDYTAGGKSGGKLTVTATASGSAGIGGGNDSSGGKITINGGTVTATGAGDGAGIGGGAGTNNGAAAITIGSTADVKAYSYGKKPPIDANGTVGGGACFVNASLNAAFSAPSTDIFVYADGDRGTLLNTLSIPAKCLNFAFTTGSDVNAKFNLYAKLSAKDIRVIDTVNGNSAVLSPVNDGSSPVAVKLRSVPSSGSPSVANIGTNSATFVNTGQNLNGYTYASGGFRYSTEKNNDGKLTGTVTTVNWASFTTDQINQLVSSLQSGTTYYMVSFLAIQEDMTQLWLNGGPAESMAVEFRTVDIIDVTFTAKQTGGKFGTADSAGIVIEFSKEVTGLKASDITVTNGTGSVTKGTLSGSGKTWTLSLSGVADQGDVTVNIKDFSNFIVETGSRTVAVYKDERTHVTFTASQTGGTSGTTDSTGIVIEFSKDVTGLTANDIKITNGKGSAVKGPLTGSGKTWTLSLSSVGSEGNLTISISDFGDFAVDTASQTVTVYKDPRVQVTFTASQTGGTPETANSKGIVIEFSKEVTGLTANNITITNDTGSAVKGQLTGSGEKWTLSLSSVALEGDVTISISDFGDYVVDTVPQTVAVYKDERTHVTFTASQTGGASGTADSAGIVIEFSKEVTELTANNITMTNGTGSAVKGTLTGSGKTWTLSLSSVASQGNVTIKISDFGDFAVDTASQTVAVYKDGRTHVTFTASQTGGSSGTTDSTGIVITFSDDVTGLTASDITIASGTGSAVKGALSGSGRTWTINITNVEEGDVNVAIRNFGSYAVTTVSETVDVYQGEQERFTLTSSSSSGGTIEWFDGSDWVMLPSEKDFEYGTEVKVRASNAGGYGFSYWSGHLFGTDPDPASMIMNADRHIEAFFYDESDHSVLKLDAAATGGKVMWSVGPSTPVQLSTAEVRFSKTVTVDLEAKADSGYVFRTWTGDLAGTASSKTLTMGDDRTVGAIFTDNSLDQTTNRTLSLGTLTGTGTIEYRIGSTGEWAVLESIMLPNNTTVELKASAGSGHTFRMWTGSMAGTGSSATLTMNGNKTVGALFTDDDLDQSTNRTLSAGTLTGKGTIEYRIGTNDEWTTLTSVVLPDDTAVELRSAAASGSTFRTWAGDIGGTSASLSITMDGNITIGAIFTDDSYDGRSNRTLTLSTIIGPGTVEYRVKNGTWAELLTVTVPNNTEIELRATTDIGSVFGGWAGDLSGNASQITVRMNTSRTIGAVFFEANYTITVIAEEGSTFRYTLGNDKAWEEFTIGPSGSYTIKNVPNGIVITIEAILFEGYEASWNIGDGKAIKNNTHTFTASNDQSITVTFTPPKTSTEKKDMMLWIVAILMLILVAALLIKAAASRDKKKKRKKKKKKK